MKEHILKLYATGAELSAADVAAKLGPQFETGGAAARYFAAVFSGVVRSGAIVEVRHGVYVKKEDNNTTQINLF